MPCVKPYSRHKIRGVRHLHLYPSLCVTASLLCEDDFFIHNLHRTSPYIENWHDWYVERYPDAFEKATDKIYAQVQNLRDAIPLIDREMVKHWVEDLVIYKTFNGMYVQKAILASLAERNGTTYRLATPEEESVGIDGYVGNVPYSVKPDTYKTMGRLSETIAVKMIYYTKTKTGLTIEVEK